MLTFPGPSDGPDEFIRTNVVGTQVLLEACRVYWSAA